MKYETLDKDLDAADWLKTTWELPPYKSVPFLELFPDLDKFRQLPVYKHAVAAGLIMDDEWMGDYIVMEKSKDYDYGEAQKGCGCLHHGADLSKLTKAASMPPVKQYVLAHEKEVADAMLKHLTDIRDLAESAIGKHLPTKKADLARLLTKAMPSLDEIVKAVLAEIKLDGLSVALINELLPALKAAFKAGGISGLQVTGFADDARIVDLLPEEALKFARARAADLVGMRFDEASDKYIPNPNPKWSITQTTRDGIRSLVREAIEQGWSSYDLKQRLLEEHFFSENRANTIARTELAIAHTQGNLKAWRETGRVGGKMSILADTHPMEDECDTNAEAGIVPLEDLFPSGDDGPPYHPNCLCAIAPVLKSEMESVDGEQNL